MELKTLMTADYLDIIFDQRNKFYGGYELRRNYKRRVKKAATMVFTSVVTLLSFSFITINHGKPKPSIYHRTDTMQLVILPPIQNVLPPAQKPATVHVNTRIFTTAPKIEPDKDVTPDKEMPKNTDMANAQPGISNTDGTDVDPGILPVGSGKPGVGVIPQPEVAPAIAGYVQQMPQFPGDLNEYLRSHLNYPELARDNGIEGRVVVKFVVNEDGSVSDAIILRGTGGGCDEEALRMINAMPRWKPGKQNGKAVKVYFSLSLKFELH